MSFGKRPAQRTERAVKDADSASTEAGSRGTIMLVGCIVGIMGMMALFTFADTLRLAIFARNMLGADMKPGTHRAMSAAGGENAATGKARPTVIDKEVIRDDQGRVSQEIIRYSDGKSETKDFHYNEAGKLERLDARNRNGQLSITTYTY